MSFKYVLRYGGKNPALTKVLHTWFDLLQFPPPEGKKSWQELGGVFTLETKKMVTTFQQKYGLTPPKGKAYGEVRATEWQQLGLLVGYRAWDPKIYSCMFQGVDCPVDPFQYTNFLKSVGGYTGNSLSGGINVYGPRFLQMYAEEFGGVAAETIAALGVFLDFMRSDKNLTDIRYAAYLMASVYKESWYTWQPIDEKGKGAGRKYGLVRVGKCGGKQYKNVYYGRGYIQITWEDGYQKADAELNLGCTLVANPERAKEPEIAYKIASQGMTDGWFNHKDHSKFSDYINTTKSDYYNARKIVNPNDTKTFGEIEAYAKIFEVILRTSMVR